jgi:hypothetical protein
VDLVLNEIVNQRNQCSKEQARHNLAVLDSTAVVGAERKAAKSPWQSSNQIRDHEDIMPVMVVGRCNVGPTSTSQSTEDTHAGNELGQSRIGTRREDVPQEDKGETRSGGNGDEDLEERPFGIAITNGRGHGGEPFVGVAVVFVLDDFVVVQSNADNQRADECCVGEEGVRPSNPFAIDLDPVSGAPDHRASTLTATTASPSLYRGAMARERQSRI